MSLKMTDFSFVSCFVYCFNNTGYRIIIMSALYLPLAAKTKEVTILAEILAEKYLEYILHIS